MTRQSIHEYAEAVRERYRSSKKTGKTKILDEFVQATRLHRKAAVRLLNRVRRKGDKKRSGRPKLYSLEAILALKVIWEASDRLCSQRLLESGVLSEENKQALASIRCTKPGQAPRANRAGDKTSMDACRKVASLVTRR